MNKGKTLLIAMRCNLKPEEEPIKSLIRDPEAQMDLIRGDVKITKEDLFSLASDGKSIFEYKEVFNHLPVIMELLQQNGEKLTPEDLVRIIPGPNKSLAKFAEDNIALDKIFTPAIWQGRLVDMENVWYQFSRMERNKYEFQVLRSAVAASVGEQTREDQWLRRGVQSSRVFVDLTSGNLKFIKDILAQHGDHLRREDLLMRDLEGETPFHSKSAWLQIEQIDAELEKNGESLRLGDWLDKRADKKTLLEKATDFDMLPKLFTAKRWKDNVGDMMKLYEAIPEFHKSKVDLRAVITEIMDMNYTFDINADNGNCRICDLVQPLTGTELKKPDGRFIVIIPLMLKSVWNKFSEIEKHVNKPSVQLDLNLLRQSGGFTNDTLLYTGAHYGQFPAIVNMVRAQKDVLTLNDLTVKNELGRSVLDEVVKHGQVGTLFAPDLWAGRVNDMAKLWGMIADDKKRDIDFGVLVSQANLMTLRNFAGNRPVLKMG